METSRWQGSEAPPSSLSGQEADRGSGEAQARLKIEPFFSDMLPQARRSFLKVP